MADGGSVPIPAEEPLDAWLGENAKKDTSVIEQIRKLLSTASGLDATLLFSNYAILLAVTGLRSFNTPAISSVTTNTAKAAGPFEPVAKNLSNLATVMLDTRLFMRLWNLLGVHRWVVSMLVQPPADEVVETIVWSQIGMNAVYITMENVAFLGKRDVLPINKKTQDDLWRLSRRIWNIHVILDFLRLARIKFVDMNRRKKMKYRRQKDMTKEERLEKAKAKEEEDEKWQREFIVNSIYAVLTMHWGCRTKLLDDSWVGALGSIAGWLSLSQAWQKAGQS